MICAMKFFFITCTARVIECDVLQSHRVVSESQKGQLASLTENNCQSFNFFSGILVFLDKNTVLENKREKEKKQQHRKLF